MFKFNLGDELKEKITGIKGIVMSKSLHLSGCRHYSIQTPMTKGTVQDWFDTDESRYTLINEGKVNFNTEEHDSKFQLGDEVEDIVLKCKGVITTICYYYDGSIYYSVQQSKVVDGKVPSIGFLHENRLKLKTVKKIKTLQLEPDRVKEPSPGPNMITMH